MVSNEIFFHVTGQGDCGSEGGVAPPIGGAFPSSGGFEIDPLLALTSTLMALLAFAAVAARRSLRRLA
jgi:hypothetical protein